MEEWGFIWLMFVLKIPIAALLYIVWWATRPVEDPAAEDSGDGGAKSRPHPPGRPRRGRPRGPHGDPVPQPERPRVRAAARAKSPEHTD